MAQHLELPIEGMTCAACARRIERQLNRLDGVHASVNYATHTATVDFDAGRVAPTALIGAVEAAGYRAATAPQHDGGRLRLRTAVAAALAAPVALLSMVPALQFDGWQWISLALTSVVVGWCGLPIHQATLRHLRHGSLSMDTLISIGTLAAFTWSLASLLFRGAGELGMRMEGGFRLGAGNHAELYFEVAAGVIALILLGRFLERGATRTAGAAIRALLEVGAKNANVLRDGNEVAVPVEAVAVGDRFVVRPGERIATDGVVEEGSSTVDRALLTGESVPVDTGPGDEVTGGTINTDGKLVVRATRVGADTALAQITRLVAAAQAGKAPVQRLADRVAGVFVPVVIALSALTAAGWLAAGRSAGFAFGAAVAVLIIACPCALGLATPAALMAGTGRGAELGILIKSPAILESTRAVDTILLDKTGTVTEGRMSLTHIALHNGTDRREVLRLAGAVEAASEHPIGRAIAAAALDEWGALPPVTGFRATPGQGVVGTVEGHAIEITRGADGIAVTWDARLRATLGVHDTVKATTPEAVRAFKDLGLDVILVTGDAAGTAERVGAQIGVTDVRAGVLPAGKAEVVRDLQAAGRVVAMAGDGINDAPALAAADLGIAMSSGADVAIASGDLTVMSGDLRAAADAIRLSRRTLRIIKGNLFWAFAYNVAAIPLAIAGLLNPLVAGGAMAFSSLFVVANSLRLRRFTGLRDAT